MPGRGQNCGLKTALASRTQHLLYFGRYGVQDRTDRTESVVGAVSQALPDHRASPGREVLKVTRAIRRHFTALARPPLTAHVSLFVGRPRR